MSEITSRDEAINFMASGLIEPDADDGWIEELEDDLTELIDKIKRNTRGEVADFVDEILLRKPPIKSVRDAIMNEGLEPEPYLPDYDNNFLEN